jgi:hypothetical protein
VPFISFFTCSALLGSSGSNPVFANVWVSSDKNQDAGVANNL